MRHFDYNDGEMFAEDVPLARIAAEVGTPVYVYSTATFTRHYRVFADSFVDTKALIAYSVKANSNIAVLATLAAQGAGADVVSGGELKRALVAGIPAEKIVFSGVGKTRMEMHEALTANIRVFLLVSAFCGRPYGVFSGRPAANSAPIRASLKTSTGRRLPRARMRAYHLM